MNLQEVFCPNPACRDEETVLQVVSLVAYGCPSAAIVAAYGIDERTVAAWLQRAGEHAEVFHRAGGRITRWVVQGSPPCCSA